MTPLPGTWVHHHSLDRYLLNQVPHVALSYCLFTQGSHSSFFHCWVPPACYVASLYLYRLSSRVCTCKSLRTWASVRPVYRIVLKRLESKWAPFRSSFWQCIAKERLDSLSMPSRAEVRSSNRQIQTFPCAATDTLQRPAEQHGKEGVCSCSVHRAHPEIAVSLPLLLISSAKDT